MSNDLINGIFEFTGGVLLWFNVYKLIQDKQVRGLYLPVCVFFAAWGIWNMFYYPSLHQMYSFIGAAFLAAANIVWVWLAYWYRFKLKNIKNIIDSGDFFR